MSTSTKTQGKEYFYLALVEKKDYVLSFKSPYSGDPNTLQPMLCMPGPHLELQKIGESLYHQLWWEDMSHNGVIRSKFQDWAINYDPKKYKLVDPDIKLMVDPYSAKKPERQWVFTDGQIQLRGTDTVVTAKTEPGEVFGEKWENTGDQRYEKIYPS